MSEKSLEVQKGCDLGGQGATNSKSLGTTVLKHPGLISQVNPTTTCSNQPIKKNAENEEIKDKDRITQHTMYCTLYALMFCVAVASDKIISRMPTQLIRILGGEWPKTTAISKFIHLTTKKYCPYIFSQLTSLTII